MQQIITVEIIDIQSVLYFRLLDLKVWEVIQLDPFAATVSGIPLITALIKKGVCQKEAALRLMTGIISFRNQLGFLPKLWFPISLLDSYNYGCATKLRLG